MTEPPVTIREAAAADAPAMGRCMVQTWLAAHRSQMPAAAWERRRLTWTPEDSAAGWLRHLRERDAAPVPDQACYLVAEDLRGVIVAVAVAAAAAVGEAGAERMADVGSLYVSRPHQRRGIGRRLLRQIAVHFQCRGITRMQIAVLEANDEARTFYEALGGHWVGDRLFDEDGDLLPERIYFWSDLTALLADRH